jgi:predicted transcriptional regulator
MSEATEIAPAKPRSPSRKVRKRDERVRRVVRKIRKHATWLDQPHFGSLLYAYGALFVRFVDLHAVEAEPIDDLGRPNAITDQLTRIAGRLGQLAAQLGLSPAAERALRHDAALEAAHRKWLAIAEDGEVVTPAPAPVASAPTPAATANGTPRLPGFTSPT